jgi:hypothetical protein
MGLGDDDDVFLVMECINRKETVMPRVVVMADFYKCWIEWQ